MNDRQIFAAAGVSLEEAEAAKEDLLVRVYDFLDYPDEDPEDVSKRFAQIRDDLSQIMDPDFPIFGYENLKPDKRLGFQAISLAAYAQSTGEIPGMALSLHDLSRLTGVPLEMLEGAYTMIRPDLAPGDAEAIKPKKKASAKSKKRGK